MAKFSPEEAQAIIDEYNQKLAAKEPISSDLAKAMRDASTGIKDYTDNLKASLDKTSNAVLRMGKALVQGESGLSVYNETIESGASAMGAWAQKIPFVGGALNSAAKATAQAVVLINKQADTLFQNYQSISRSGLVTGMADTFKNLEAAGYTVAEIQEYGALMKQNADTLSTFGGTAAQGAKQFADIAQSIQNSDAQTNFMMLGMNVNDINSGVANYIKIQQLSGSTKVQTNLELKESAQEFIMQQDRLAKLTGLNAEQQNKVYERALAMEQYSAQMQTLQARVDAGDKSAQLEIDRNKEVMQFAFAKGNQALADDAAMFLAGAVNSDGAQRFQRSFAGASKLINSGVKDASVINKQMTQDANKTLREQTTLGVYGQYNKNFSDLSGTMKLAAASVNDVTVANTTATEQQQDQIKGNDDAVKASVKLRQNQRDTTQSLDTMINKGVEPVAKGFAGLTSVAQQLVGVAGQAAGKQGQIGGGTSLLNKIGIGSPPSAAAPISTSKATGAPGAGATSASTSAPTLDNIKNTTGAAAPTSPGVGTGGGLVAGMDDVKQMIIRHEGVRTKPYIDTLGNWTVGVGHLIGKSLPADMNREFTQQEIMSMFEQDFAKHYTIAQRTPGWDKANESGKGAMVDLAFNMGQWWTKFPNTAKALMSGDFTGAATGLKDSNWYKQVGNRGPTIVGLMSQAGGPSKGTLSGPSSQYNSQVSSNSSSVSLPNGRSIPVSTTGESVDSSENNKIISMKISKLDQLINGMIKNNSLSNKILQRQS
jgi:lysozyme